jgi:tetratricopeptide (TPR) repeat protein
LRIKFKQNIISFFLIIAGSFLFAQKSKVDSLLGCLQKPNNDTSKINILNELGYELRNSDALKSLDYINEAIALAEKNNFLKGFAVGQINAALVYLNTGEYDKAQVCAAAGIKTAVKIGDRLNEAKGYNITGEIFRYRDEYPKAIENYEIAYKIRKEINDEKGIASTLNNLGIIYFNLGNYPKALSSYFDALKIREKISDIQGVAACYNNIALVYLKQLDFDDAFESNMKALKIRQELNDKRGIATSYTNIANILKIKGEYPQAIEYYEQALKLFQELGDKKFTGGSYNNIGCVFENQAKKLLQSNNIAEANKKIQEALINFNKAEKFYSEVSSTSGLILICENVGQVYMLKKDFVLAKKYFLRGLELSKKIDSREEIKNFYFDLSDVDSALSNYSEALRYYKLYIEERDGLINQENTKKTVQLQMQYDFDKKEATTKAEQEKKDAVALAEKQRQKSILLLISVVLFLVVCFAVFIFRSLRITKKQKMIIEEQKQTVEHQKQLVEEKQKEIIDSINYARRIQQSILPSEKYISKVLKN